MKEMSSNLSFTLLLLSGGSPVWFMTARSRKLIVLHVVPVSSWHLNSVLYNSSGSENTILALNCLPGVFTLETSSILKSGSSVSVVSSSDVLHAVVPSVHCLSACWLVFRMTNRCKMIWLQAQVACLTICFACFFPMLLCSSTSAAILLCAL